MSDHIRRVTPEQEQDIVRRYLAGKSSGPIGAALGFSEQGIRNILERNGVQRRYKNSRVDVVIGEKLEHK
jgi:hypothetical protein